MKTRFLNKMAGLLAVLLLFSCTGKFEEYNTDNTGFTDEQKTYDYNTFGVWLKVVQMGIYFNYDWGSYGTIRLFLGGFNVSLCVNDPISRFIRFCR